MNAKDQTNNMAHMSALLRSFRKALLAAACCFPMWTYGQEDSLDVNELVKLSLDELINLQVSTASKISQKMSEAPSVVSLINRDQLQRYQWISLNDAAGRQAGYTIGQDRFNRYITSRGISDLLWSKRLLVLCDGVPFSSFQSTVTDEAFSLNMAKNLELVRGPGAVLYGTQALTGVLQVNTLSYADLKYAGELEIKAGDYATNNINLLTGAKGKYFNTILSFTSFRTAGNEYDSYDALLLKDSLGNFRKFSTQDERTSNHFWLKLEGKDKTQGLSLNYHFQNYSFQMGHGFLTVIPSTDSKSQTTRHYLMAKYVSPDSEKKLKSEYVLKYDHELSDMNMEIIPIGFKIRYRNGTDSTGATVYVEDSSGVFEHYSTPVNSAFARGQWIYFFGNKMTLMGGIEQDMVLYRGDKYHYSNLNLNHNANPRLPFPEGGFGHLKSLYETIEDRPVNNTGIFVQLTSGRLLGDKLTATLGGRYDVYYYKYKDLNDEQVKKRDLNHFSPRLVLIYNASKDLSLRLMYGNAFRVASPFEQFISNSIITGLNRKNLGPEELDTYEASADWSITPNIHFRNTVFCSRFHKQIRPSAGTFANTTETRQSGLESEVTVIKGRFNGFFNYSFVKRFEEKSTDTAIVLSNSLIWYPAHSVNAGVAYNLRRFELAVQTHYQSAVDRRSSEKGAPKSGANKGINMDLLRGAKVAAWQTVDANLSYHISDHLLARFTATNVFNKKYNLINNLGGVSPQPFDYQQAGRRLLLSLKLMF